MKKNLLSLALILSAGIYTSAQNTYINDAVTVKVNPNTLFFHGGDVTITNTSGDTKKIINDGNIQIAGNFSNTSTTGKNFVNTYTAPDASNDIPLNYGQLIINQGSDISGGVTLQRSTPSLNNDYYGIGLPFKGESVESIINNMTGSNSFSGDCAVNVRCSSRYDQSAFIWDVANTEYDPVPSTTISSDTNETNVVPGGNYTIKLNNGSIRNFIAQIANNPLELYGSPNNNSFVKTYISGIRGKTKTEFSGYTWGQWKNLVNNYNETYYSYLGVGVNVADNSTLFGKNLHRFSNPFTSNIDLSIINKPDPSNPLAPISWIKFNTTSGVKYPTEAYSSIIRFKISRLPIDLYMKWNQDVGGYSSATPTRVSAYLSQCTQGCTTDKPYFWTGNPEALIIKPTEYFEVEYYSLSPSLNGSRIVEAEYDINDTHKTFNYSFPQGSNNPENVTGVYARYNDISNNIELQNRGLIGPNDFTQIEFYLTKNNKIEAEAAYLVNSSFYETGNATGANLLNNKIFLYEESLDGTVNKNNQTLLNQFKNDFLAKPLAIGFNNLNNGDSYSIKLRLFEYSILNSVNRFNNGTYYLYDKNTNQISEVNSNTEINFIADNNINNRFELYWNEVPKTLATDDLSTAKATLVYFNNNNHFVRFEDNNTKATVKVFDLNGRLISTHLNINTNEDLKLNIPKGSAVYIINIEYDNGTTVSKKIIQN